MTEIIRAAVAGLRGPGLSPQDTSYLEGLVASVEPLAAKSEEEADRSKEEADRAQASAAELAILTTRFLSGSIPGLAAVELFANGMVISASGVDPVTGTAVTYFADGSTDASIPRSVQANIPSVAELTLFANGQVAAGNDPETIYNQRPAAALPDGTVSDGLRYKDEVEIAPLPLVEKAAFVRNGPNWLWNANPEPQQTEATAVRLPSGYRAGSSLTVAAYCALLIGGTTDNAPAKIGWVTGTLSEDLNSLTWGTAGTLVDDTHGGVTGKLQKGALYNSSAGRGRLFVGRIPNSDGYTKGVWEIYTTDHANWVGAGGAAFTPGSNTNGMIKWDDALIPSDLSYLIPSPAGGIYANGVEYLPCYGVPNTVDYRTIIYSRSDPDGPMSEFWSISTYLPGDAERGGGYAGAEPSITCLPNGNLLIVCRPANKSNNLPLNGIPWWVVAPDGSDVARGNFSEIPGVMIGGGILSLNGPRYGRLVFVGPKGSAGSGMSDTDWTIFISYDQGNEHSFDYSVTPFPQYDKRSTSLTGRKLSAEYWYRMYSGNSSVFAIDDTRFVTLTERAGPTNNSGVTGAYNAIATMLVTVANAIRSPEPWENVQ